MAAITFTWANADFDRRHSTSEIGQSLPNFTIRNISVRPPIADMRADIAGRRFGTTSDELAPQRLTGTSGFVGWIIAPRERLDRPRQMSPDRPIYL
jgi:hypothetical protein